MRPVRLRIEGLRSFHTAREIDFSNLGLVAIVGDTGAGKSSILEAITYALYNGTTWDQRNARALITDGLNTMKVELDFTAEGDTWRVIRSTSKGGYPPPIHSLQCLSDPGRPKVDGEADVAHEIRKLIGLDYETFCSAVVLPQGRFQALLQARTRERTTILKSIFRLDLLTNVREAADLRLRELQPRVEGLRLERAKLAGDPRAEADELAKTAKQHGIAADRLDAARTKHRGLIDACRQATEAAAPLTAFLSELSECTLPATLFAQLLPQFEGLDREATTLDERDEKATAAVKQEDARIRQAESDGEGKSALEQAKTMLKRVSVEQPMLAVEDAEISTEDQAITDRAAELDRETAGRNALVSSMHELEKRRDQAAGGAKTAQDSLDAAATALREYAAATDRTTSAGAAVDRATNALATAKTRLAAATAQVEEATRTRDEARERLGKLERAHAAAHAAAGLSPGDPCPICARELPEGFEPPVVPGQEEGKSILSAAENAWMSAREDATRAKADVDHAQTALDASTATRKTEEDALAKAKADASKRLNRADPRGSEEELLAPLRAAVRSTAKDAATAESAFRDKERALVELDAQLKPRHDALETRRTELDRRRKALAQRRDQLSADRERIPAPFRPTETTTDFDTLTVELDARLGEVSGWHDARDKANAERSEITDERRVIQRRRDQLAEPHRVAHDHLTHLHGILNDGARLIGEPVEPAVPAGPLAEESASAVGAEARATKLTQAVEAALAAKAKDAEKATAAAVGLLGSLDVRDAAQLEARLIEARTEQRQAATEEAKFRSQIAVALDLDRRLGPLDDLTTALDAVCRLLTDAQFVAFAVGRRQLALLGTASEILGEMTGDRYGFSKEFEIVDKLSGQPRSPRTLSGGESFLASLALALSLVEMAARSGGRLEALFLDEGFGSLDADALDEALGELERRASAGQLVGLISHVSAVAERIETVLRVDRTAQGSVVRLVDQSGRWEMVEQELGEGLLG